MRSLRLELLDEEGAVVCSGLALLWEREDDPTDGWGGEFFQIEQPAPRSVPISGWVRSASGMVHEVLPEGLEECSSGGQRVVRLRFRGLQSSPPPPLDEDAPKRPVDPGRLA